MRGPSLARRGRRRSRDWRHRSLNICVANMSIGTAQRPSVQGTICVRQLREGGDADCSVRDGLQRIGQRVRPLREFPCLMQWKRTSDQPCRRVPRVTWCTLHETGDEHERVVAHIPAGGASSCPIPMSPQRLLACTVGTTQGPDGALSAPDDGGRDHRAPDARVRHAGSPVKNHLTIRAMPMSNSPGTTSGMRSPDPSMRVRTAATSMHGA